MHSVVTGFSVENAWNGAVSHETSLLELEEARKILFVKSLNPRKQVDLESANKGGKAESPLSLFDLDPLSLTSVLFGENGCGKTTVQRLLSDLHELVYTAFQQVSDRDGYATEEDLTHWVHGVIPKRFRDPNRPGYLKMSDLSQNSVIRSMLSEDEALTEFDPALIQSNSRDGLDRIGDGEMSDISSFSLSLEGVCDHLESGDLTEVSHDCKFSLDIRGVRKHAWIMNDRLMRVPNFQGLIFNMELKFTSFDHDINSSYADDPKKAMIGIVAENNVLKKIETSHNLPFLVHPNGSVLALGRLILNPDSKFPDNWKMDDEFYDVFVKSADSTYRNLIRTEADLKELEKEGMLGHGGFSNIAKLHLHEGLPTDFFLCPTTNLPYKRGVGSVELPNVEDKTHFEAWWDYEQFEFGEDNDLDVHRYGGEQRKFSGLFGPRRRWVKSLLDSIKFSYVFLPDHHPQSISIPHVKHIRFVNRNASQDVGCFTGLKLAYHPPENALVGLFESMTLLTSLKENQDEQINLLQSIYNDMDPSARKFILEKRQGGEYAALMKLRPVTDDDYKEQLNANFVKFFSDRNLSEEHLSLLIQNEIRHVIMEEVEFLWNMIGVYNHIMTFQTLKKHLEEFTGLTIENCNFEMSTEHLRKLGTPHQQMKWEEFSSGQQNFVSLLFELARPNPNLGFVDEPELSLHVTWQLSLRDIVASIVNYSKRQVMFATHSPEIIMKFGNRSISMGRIGVDGDHG